MVLMLAVVFPVYIWLAVKGEERWRFNTTGTMVVSFTFGRDMRRISCCVAGAGIDTIIANHTDQYLASYQLSLHPLFQSLQIHLHRLGLDLSHWCHVQKGRVDNV